jgi:hypothetical protein
MSGGLEAIDAAVLGQPLLPENRTARHWMVGLMIGAQALTLAGLGEVAAERTSQAAPAHTLELTAAPHHHTHAHTPHHHKSAATTAPTHIPTVKKSVTPTHTAKATPLHHKSPTAEARPAARAHLVQDLLSVLKIFADVGWPEGNCDALMPMFVDYARVNINHGKNFTTNQCLDQEVAHLGSIPYGLYVNSGFPGKRRALEAQPKIKKDCQDNQTVSCVAKNWGRRAGMYAVNVAVEHNAYQPDIAIDIETLNAWSKNTDVNVASIKGEMAGLRLGARRHDLPEPNELFYYAPYHWTTITHDWKMEDVPVWLAHGSVGRKTAKAACNNTDHIYNTYEHSGGPLVAVQYPVYGLTFRLPGIGKIVENLDLNVFCEQPNAPAAQARKQ